MVPFPLKDQLLFFFFLSHEALEFPLQVKSNITEEIVAGS